MFFLLLILISMDWIRIHIIYPFTEFEQLPTYSNQWWLYNALFVFLTPVQGCNKDSNNAADLVSTSKISDFYAEYTCEEKVCLDGKSIQYNKNNNIALTLPSHRYINHSAIAICELGER